MNWNDHSPFPFPPLPTIVSLVSGGGVFTPAHASLVKPHTGLNWHLHISIEICHGKALGEWPNVAQNVWRNIWKQTKKMFLECSTKHLSLNFYLFIFVLQHLWAVAQISAHLGLVTSKTFFLLGIYILVNLTVFQIQNFFLLPFQWTYRCQINSTGNDSLKELNH